MTAVDSDLRQERFEARTEEFRAGQIDEPVYRALCYSHGLRGDAMRLHVWHNSPQPVTAESLREANRQELHRRYRASP